jgi:hypothetical protein
MFQACRPAGRLFYLALAVVVTTSGVRAWGREVPAEKTGVSTVAKTSATGVSARAASPNPQSGPVLTSVIDNVYMADGSGAQGTLVITWPAFTTASGTAVAPGSLDVTLGTNGALDVALVPNAGATPTNVYYSVVYQLQPNEVRTEYWVVPTTSPVTLAQVRTTPGAGTASAPASMQYVNTQLAAKANDNTVVHLAGTETVTGTKTFAVPPNVPTPVGTGDVTNKAYVDSAIATVGAGNYLPTAGGAMTGPLTLSGNPTAPLQAAAKQYVDASVAAKADLVGGLVPTSELGSGTASSLNCLLGSGAWGPCGSSANATAIQSVPVASSAPGNGQVLTYSSTSGQYAPVTPSGGIGSVSVTPAGSQNIAQPAGTQFSTNNLANIRYVTPSWNWMQSPSDNLSTPGSNTIHLSPCPLGIDTASASNYYLYAVYIAGTGTPEAAPVTESAGSCPPGANSGTITVTTQYAHGAGYTVGSSTGGIQEAWNDAWVNDFSNPPYANAIAAPYVKLVADTSYNVYSSIYMRGRGGELDGAGAMIVCSTRDRCIYIANTDGNPGGQEHKLYNLTGTSTVNQDGVQVSSVSAVSGTYTITTASAHGFVVGDTVDCEYYSNAATQHWVSKVLGAELGATQFEVNFGTSTFSGAGLYTFGFCNILNTFIEDNSDHVAIRELSLLQSGEGLGYFSYGVVDDNDQALSISGTGNRGSGILKNSSKFPNGAYIYERTDQGNSGIIYLHDAEFTNINCVTAGGNGLVITDTVCQSFPTFGVRYFGGLQPLSISNMYQESGGITNLLMNLGAQAGILTGGGNGSTVTGTFPIQGYAPVFASGGSATVQRNYFVVPRSSALGYGPVLFAGSAQPASTGANILVQWPSVELQSATNQSLGTVAWDVLVTIGTGATPPYGSGTYALATGIMGSCTTGGICSFLDTQGTISAYTVAAQQFNPTFWFWPATFVLNGTSPIFVNTIDDGESSVSSLGITGVSIVADECISGSSPYEDRSPIWMQCLGTSNNPFVATLLQEQDGFNNGPVTNSKGRLNFGKPVGNTPNDILTLQDSNFNKTTATAGERPSNDAGDMAIGVDQTGGLSERAATSISSYIGVIPTGSNYEERLTGSGKTFNVPVNINGNLTVTGTCTGCGSGGSGTVNSGTASELAMYSASGAAVSGDASLTDSGTTLNYAGTNGISAAAGTFSGNVTVNGQLLVAGPWMVSSPIPGTAMGAAGAGTSALGISNDGNFYISANAGTLQKVATTATSSYFSNLFQEDANDIGEYNGTTAQNLHVYSSYTNSSTWQRTSLGFDATDNYAVVRSENSTSGAAPGLGFWVNSGLKWVIDASSNLKPWTDQTYNVGSFNSSGSGSGLRPATVYVSGNSTSGSGLELGKFANQSYELCNDTTNGTIVNGLAVLTTAGCAVKPASALTSGAIGVVIASAGASGVVTLARMGSTFCSFDGTATVVGDFVVPSSTASGGFYPLCHDAGATQPTGIQVLGRVLQASSGSTTVQMFLDMPGSNVSSSAAYAIPWFTAPTTGTAISFSSTANKAELWGAVLTFPLSTTQVTYYVSTPDNTSNTYDIGMLNSSGNVVAHIGSTVGTTFAPSTGWKTLSWAAGATLQPGKYYLAITSSCTSACAQIYGGSSAAFSFLGGSNGTAESVTAGGTLNSGITIPSDNPTEATVMSWEIH